MKRAIASTFVRSIIIEVEVAKAGSRVAAVFGVGNG